jgi:hypothetical protein
MRPLTQENRYASGAATLASNPVLDLSALPAGELELMSPLVVTHASDAGVYRNELSIDSSSGERG